MSQSSASDITVYTTSWCAFCHTELQWLDYLGVPYTAKDIEADKSAYEELMAKNGGNYQGVPVTDVKGDLVLGFDRPRLQETMKKHGIVSAPAANQ